MYLVPIKLHDFKFSSYKKFIHFLSLFPFYGDYFEGLKISIFCIFF